MTTPPRPDPLTSQAYADALLQRTGDELGRVLQQLAAALTPFPAFLGMPTIQAVEVDPPLKDPGRGCVVVCSDGKLYELLVTMIPGPPGVGGVDALEEFNELDLPPAEYVAYAYRAIQALANHLKRR